MKAPEAYRIIRAVIDPGMRSHGFRRTRGGLLGYSRPVMAPCEVLCWFQVDRWGWEPGVGSRFVAELQLGVDPIPGSMSALHRERIGALLTATDRERILDAHNRIVAEVSHPPEGPHGSVDEHLEQLPTDVWFRYTSESDLQMWAALLEPILHRELDRFADHVNGWSGPLADLSVPSWWKPVSAGTASH